MELERALREDIFAQAEDPPVKSLSKRSLFAVALSVVLWTALILWAFYEVLGLYSWIKRRPGEGNEHFKGRLEEIAENSRLLGIGLFLGSAGAAALTLAMLYSQRVRGLEVELARQKGRLGEVEELGLAAAGLAHETKNPLGLMRGMAQRIASGSADATETKELALRIMDQSDLTSSRLGDFLRYAGVKEPSFELLGAKATLSKMATLLSDDFKVAGVALEVEADPVRIEADREMLSQILVNLLLNSLKFTPKGGRVKALLKAGYGGDAVLTVADSGSGIPPEVAPHIFKPYYSRRAGGCGLGLAIVKRMVERLGWQISVETAVGKGTSVSIKGIDVKGRETGPEAS